MRRFASYFTKPLFKPTSQYSRQSKLIGSTLLLSTIASGLYLKNKNSTLLTQFSEGEKLESFEESTNLTKEGENLSHAQQKVKEAQAYTKVMNSVTLDFAENYQEGKMYVHKIPLQDGNFEVLVTKLDGEFYAIANTDPYDGNTKLSKGKLFGNKLMSPMNGSAYNVKTGEVEYGPALDNVPIFKCNVKDGYVNVMVPKKPPVKIRPYLSSRDFADMRKVVIIGGGESALACAETMRFLSYEGEISIITPHLDVPINKRKLLSTVKFMNYDKLRIRNERFLQNIGIDFKFGQLPKQFMTKNKQAFLITESDTLFEYDACLVATESLPIIPEMKNLNSKKNVSMMRNVEDHKYLRKYLESGKVKNLTVFGMNPDSYQMVSVLRTEYPEINITVVSPDKKSWTKNYFGSDVSKALKKMHQNRGVQFYQGRQFIRFDAKEDKPQEIGKINLKGATIDTDYVLLFPSKFEARTNFVAENKRLMDNMKFDEYGRIKPEYNNNTGSKRVFVAGEPSAMTFFLTTERIGGNLYHKNVNEGFNAAYNILGLHIPYQIVPFDQFEMYGNTIQQVGSCEWFSQYHVVGDFENMDWTCFYGKGDNIYKVLGTNKHGDMQVWNEALRLGLMPSMNTVKSMGEDTYKMIEDRVKKAGRSGCFRELIYKIRYDPIDDYVLWRERSNRIGDIYDKENERITMKEINEGLQEDAENFFNQR